MGQASLPLFSSYATPAYLERGRSLTIESMSHIYIFAYGSLMNPRSLEKTLPGDRATRHANLRGYRRKASIPFGGYAYLNLVEDNDHEVSGLLIPINEAEFSLFSSREEGYDRVDVTDKLKEKLDGKAYAFIAPDSNSNLKVPRSYIETCTVGMTSVEKEAWIRETIMKGIEEDLDNPVYEFHA